PDLVIYDNPMDGTKTTNWINDTTHCTFKPDGYHITASYICFAPPDDISDVVITVNAKQLSGVNSRFYVIVLRTALNVGSYYAFESDGNGKWMFEVVKNQQVTRLVDITPNPAIQTGLGVVNALQVSAVGSHFEFTVNGTKVGQADDPSFPSGLVGLFGQ